MPRGVNLKTIALPFGASAIAITRPSQLSYKTKSKNADTNPVGSHSRECRRVTSQTIRPRGRGLDFRPQLSFERVDFTAFLTEKCRSYPWS